MKKFLLPAMALMPLMAMGSTEWTLSKAEWPYQVDTTYHATVGPGTTLTNMTLTSLPRPSDGKTNVETPLIKAFYLTVDLTDPNVSVKTFLAGDKRNVRQTVPNIATNHETSDMQVVAGVNSDFFNTTTPYLTNGAAVTDGFLMAPQNASPWAHVMIDQENKASFVGDVSLSRQIVVDEGDDPVNLVINKIRTLNAYAFYYQDEFAYKPDYSRNKWGSEVYVKPVGDQPWGVPSSEWEVISTPTALNTDGNVLSIDEGQIVLSGNGTAGTRVSKMKVGDRFKVMNTLTSGGSVIAPVQLAGGNQMILTKGVQIDVTSNPAPRTLVGADESGTKLVMMCIDGRQAGGSYGAYYRLCAAIMQAVGCYNAMEFDGGGSTTMYVKPLGGVQNIPSEGSLRPVAEGFFVTAPAVTNWNVTRIEVVEKGIKLKRGESFRPHVYGFNPDGVLIDNNVTGFTLQCKADPSAVSGDALNFIPQSDGMYVLTVNYGRLSIDVPVAVGDLSGVDEVIADENAEVEYFNLQGMAVSNPTPGLYIRRQGSMTTKVLIK